MTKISKNIKLDKIDHKKRKKYYENNKIKTEG